MKKQVLQLLKNPTEDKSEFFNEALLLFARSANVPHHQLRHFNANGFSNARLESLIYELKKLHEISDADIVLFEMPATGDIESNVDATDMANAAKTPRDITEPTSEEKKTWGFDWGMHQNPISDAVKIVMEKSLPEGEQPSNIFAIAPDTVKEDIKLREEFPFLNTLDCPDELKVLVADKMTHYAEFVDAHKKLLVIVPGEGQEPVDMSADEIYELAKKAVENFTINQDIYAELEAYKNTGKVLGQHSKLRRLKMIQSIEAATPASLAKRLSNLQNYINRENAKLNKTVDSEEKLKLDKKIEGYKEEQELVKEKLGANGNKE